MNDLENYFNKIIEDNCSKIVISKTRNSSEEYKKLVVTKLESFYQISKYTDKQVFHENLSTDDILKRLSELTEGHFYQINGFSDSKEHMLMISKKGVCSYKAKSIKVCDNCSSAPKEVNHNRKKNYILEEGRVVEPLVDMGVFTKEGKVVNSMYDKFKQINRFLEILDDEISKSKMETINVIDFGCGKSYLTFIIYYYLVNIKGIKANIIGLDLKEDVIAKCNASAKKYGYDNLKFYVGDVNGFKAPFDVDLVVTLHACDTATDYALYNAISWDAKMIFSVPCCQHELNSQIKTDSLSILTRYGILKERFSAIATDAIRGNILEYSGYKTQLLEFIDFDHTPKNILIRAVKRPITHKAIKEKALKEINDIIKEFNFNPCLYDLIFNNSNDKN